MYLKYTCMLVLIVGYLVDAAPSKNDTHTKPDNNGLGSLFSMTRGFIDLVMTKKSLFDALNEEAGEKKSFFQGGLSQSEQIAGIQNVAKNVFIGYAICIFIGLVFIIVMPIVGCCFCVCRSVGKCGGKPRRKTRTFTCNAKMGPDPKKVYFSVFFVITVAFMLGAVACIFLNNDLLHGQTSMSSDSSIVRTAVKNLNRTEDYINEFIQELNDLVIDGFHVIVKKVFQTLNETSTKAKNKLSQATDTDKALDKAKKLAETLRIIKERFSEVNETTAVLKEDTAALKEQLDGANTNLSRILQDCNTAACAAILDASHSALKLGANFSQVDDVADKLHTVVEADWAQLKANTEKADEAVQNITNDISTRTDSAVEDVKNKMDGEIRKDIVQQVDNSKKDIKKTVTFDKFRDMLNNSKDTVNTYGNYIYWTGLALGCTTLLIVLLYFVGLLFVTCCNNDRSSCNRNTGTNFLMAGVGFTFVFAMFLMLVTSALFIIGTPLYSVACRYTTNLSDPTLTKELDKFVDSATTTFKANDLSISDMMAKCGKDESLYNAASLGDRFSLVEYLNISKYPALTNAIDDLRSKTFDIGDVDVLSDDTKNKLNDLINASVDNVNFTSFEAQVSRNVIGGDLNQLIILINETAIRMRDINKTTTADDLETQAATLASTQAHTVPELEQKKANLSKAVDRLQTILEANGGFTVDTRRLLNSLKAAEDKLTSRGNHLLTGIVADLADDVLNDISNSLISIAEKLTNDLGRCKEPLDIIQSTVDIGCVSVLGPFNALWFSLGWFIFFSIPGIIFAVKLVGVYRAKVPGTGQRNYEHCTIDEEHLDAYPMNYQPLTLRDNHGYETDYEE